MTPRIRSSLVLIGVVSGVALFSACGGTGYCADYANANCKNIMDCCSSAKRQSLLGDQNVNDQGKCQSDAMHMCENLFAAQLYAVKQGTATYSSEKAAACFKAMDRGSNQCSVYLDKSPTAEACKDSPFTGAVALGGACHWNFECGETAYCSAEKCVAFAKENEACGTVPCVKGLYCSGGKCAAPKAAGAACSSTSECADTLYCDTTCKARQGPGSPCTSDNACASNECLPGTCASGAMCMSDASCFSSGTCKHTTSRSCTSDYSCGKVCSISGNTCSFSSDCGTGETCDYDKCQMPGCSGRVCGSPGLVSVNYCPL